MKAAKDAIVEIDIAAGHAPIRPPPQPAHPLPFGEIHLAAVFRRDDGTCLGWDTWHPNREAAEDACKRIGDSPNFVTRIVTYVPKGDQ